MTDSDQSEKFYELRKRAEQMAEEQLSGIVYFSPEETKKIIQDLRVHQIELELQNEDLRQTQLKLEAARHKYADLYDFSPVGLLTLDDHAFIEEANLTFVMLMGMDRENLIKRNLSDFIHSSSQDVYHLFFQSLRSGQQTAPCEITLLQNNQISLPVRLDGSVLVQAGVLPTYRISVSDITQRKQAELKRTQLDLLLATERLRLANIIATVPGIFWENQYNSETKVMKLIFISAYVEPVLGYTVDEALAKPDFWYTLFHPEDAQRAVDEFYTVRQSGRTGVVSFRALHKDGHTIDIDAYMMAIMEDGKPVATRGVMMDVSERQQLMNAQTRYAAMLRRSNEQLQQFAYIASHDLQEPLRMVISYLQLLERRYANALDADAHEFITYAVDGAARMKELIAGLLQLSRIEGEQDVLESLVVQEVVDQALTNLSGAIADSHAVITYDPLPSVQANSLQLMQLFQNLVGNAIKFCTEQPIKIHIGVEKKTDEWQFYVRDNGIGIAPEYQARVFAMFQRLHTRTEYAGTGIGLAICKKIVERHNGRIWIESAVGQGATFYFTLPITPLDRLEIPASTNRPHSY